MASPRKIETLINRVCFALRGDYATGETVLRAQVQNALADTQNEMWRSAMISDFVSETTLTTVADQQDYDLPFDVDRIITPGVKYDTGTRGTLRFLPQQDWDAMDGDTTETTGEPTCFTLRGRASFDGSTGSSARIIRLFPTPDDAYVLRYSYFARPFSIASSPESHEVDDRWAEEFVDLFVNGAIVKFPQFVTSDQLAVHESRYRRGLRELAGRSHAIIGEDYPKMTGFERRNFVGGIPNTVDTGWSAAE
ncbi:MAG: hypothetical protein E6R03_04345 [Hyphomicrobiaceae bacterium]|nr:MAG: hypothetical protein E6R03_04345 [Hyphomicrobiaceae bacterium]